MVYLPAAGRHGGYTMFTVYAIKSKSKDWIYVGLTSNFEKRFKQHNLGQVKSSKAYLPFVVIYTETLDNRADARIREKYYKHGQGKDKLKKMMHAQVVEWYTRRT